MHVELPTGPTSRCPLEARERAELQSGLVSEQLPGLLTLLGNEIQSRGAALKAAFGLSLRVSTDLFRPCCRFLVLFTYVVLSPVLALILMVTSRRLAI